MKWCNTAEKSGTKLQFNFYDECLKKLLVYEIKLMPFLLELPLDFINLIMS